MSKVNIFEVDLEESSERMKIIFVFSKMEKYESLPWLNNFPLL